MNPDDLEAEVQALGERLYEMEQQIARLVEVLEIPAERLRPEPAWQQGDPV